MLFPAVDDTIIAVSSAWEPSPLGIIRLSGPESFGIAAGVLEKREFPDDWRRPRWRRVTLSADDQVRVPALAYTFRAPRSYTGQDVVELHCVGCLPLLRATCARLIAAGARRALPGEFTARAFLNGKLDAARVDDVLDLLQGAGRDAARRSARERRAAVRARLAAAAEDLAALIAGIEAGIDFVDEEDVSFVTPDEVRRAVDRVLLELGDIASLDEVQRRDRAPHVALVGLPNAGKSTLFNALLGYERAIVSPVLGTTRDVLTTELELDGVRVMLQDSAGLGAAQDELDAAAHQATERAAETADLVLWVHDGAEPFTPAELEALGRACAGRVIVVLNKADRPGVLPLPDLAVPAVRISALTRIGMDELAHAARAELAAVTSGGELDRTHELAAVAADLRRARGLAVGSGEGLTAPELIAVELRSAWERLSAMSRGEQSEDVLRRIFTRFCIGK